ncbi:MAG: fibrobacter succinogenes major paralogous domain-containing protein [Mariniphaga sp.]
MKTKTIHTASVVGMILLVFCAFLVKAQTLKDIDGNDYKTIKYGLQEWTASNLNVSKFINGDVIPQAKTDEEWIKSGSESKPAWCYFDNDPENGKKFGKLYNWYAISDKRGLAPKGWLIPVSADWMTLVKNNLGVDVAGIKLKSKAGWKSKNGTDNIGFTALPGGVRDESGAFKNLSTKCQWWANSEPVEVKKSNLIYSLLLEDYNVQVSYLKMKKESGLSVRCIKAKN